MSTASSPRRRGTTPERRPAGGPWRPSAVGSPARAGTGRPAADQRPDAGQPFGQVALDVDVAGDVGAGEAQLVRVPQQPTHRRARTQHHDRRTGGPGLAAVPRPDPDGERRRAPRPPRRRSGRPRCGRGRGCRARELLSSRGDPPVFAYRPRTGCRRPEATHRHGVCFALFPPRPLVVARPRAIEGPGVPGDPRRRTVRSAERSALAPRPVRPAPGRSSSPGLPIAPSCNGRWSPDRREEAHAHAGEGRGDRRDHRAVPELQCGRAHRVPRADRGPADPAAPFPRCGQQLRRRQEHPDEAGGGLGRFLRPRPAAQRPHRDRLHRG